MKLFFHIAGMLGVTLLLSGCPDSNMPKTPPKAPEPKAASIAPSLGAAMLQADNQTSLIASARPTL